MGSATLAALLVVTLVVAAVAYAVGLTMSKRAEPWRDSRVMGVRRVRGPGGPVPGGRPIEEIATDLRRLGTRFHTLPEHASYAKSEAFRAAYDHVLAECCAALGLTHLLGVLAPGPELDAERARVENQLVGSGLRLPYAA